MQKNLTISKKTITNKHFRVYYIDIHPFLRLFNSKDNHNRTSDYHSFLFCFIRNYNTLPFQREDIENLTTIDKDLRFPLAKKTHGFHLKMHHEE